ncbi:class IV lanthionine synthetase LanL [Streptomyces noursei]|uniref:class IV lanthionine synthetase LanL n=1 Tax=Streptomyces noursei TaxID=1971 RepID=UPI0019661147|nr:class IV lanthionine synthetase LanL [Streptomyces noursei]QRX94942.1 class IV lanthionine synthetase LanL [Streptomyces noursei]
MVRDTVLLDVLTAVLSRAGDGEAGPLGGWRVRAGEFWCYVSPPRETRQVQGWKLHVSATPLSAPVVLSRAAEVLVRRGCRFKFAGTLERAGELVSRHYERGGGGKFLTVYPEGDEDWLRDLAGELHRATLGLPGPGILSDLPCFPHSLVHYRYGVFSGVTTLDGDGTRAAMLIAPDGALVRDNRRPWFAPPSWAPRDPFAPGRVAEPPKPAPVLLHGRFLVRGVIRHAFAGGVYRAVDQGTGHAVIVKQARRHAAATLAGGDARDMRHHEARMLEGFADSGFTPRPVAVFEQQGDLFLVQEAITGVTLRRWVLDRLVLDDGEEWGPDPDEALTTARRLAEAMRAVHHRGWVLRDFNPNNVMVTDDGTLRLIDLETLARPGEHVVRVHTPGYAAAEQVHAGRIDAAPGIESDLYSLGATLFYLATGVDPLLAPGDGGGAHKERLVSWLARLSAGNPAARRLAPLIGALLDDDPTARPALDEVLHRLRTVDGERARSRPAPVSRGIGEGELKQLITDGLDHLLATMDPGRFDRLWPSGPVGTVSDPFNIQHGAAGVLGVLVLAHRLEPQPALRTAVRSAADWISGLVGREPRCLPGLYYGRSGTAWALLDAAGLLADASLLAHATGLAAGTPVEGPVPDICHGVAGAGLTQLRFWEATGEPRFLDRARRAAEAVAALAVRRDGLLLWPIPGETLATSDTLAHYGFAHGVAGVGAFLLAAARATGTAAYAELAVEAARTLLAVVEVEGGCAYWRTGEPGSPRKTHWCSGSSGAGTFLLHTWLETGDEDFLTAARQAAAAVRRTRWHEGPTQCHGLAGDGEFLLDLAQATGDGTYRDWAAELATGIHARHVVRDGRMVVPDDTGTAVWADFNTGLSGVVAFLARLAHGGPRMWVPHSLTAAEPEDPGAGVARATSAPVDDLR